MELFQGYHQNVPSDGEEEFRTKEREISKWSRGSLNYNPDIIAWDLRQNIVIIIDTLEK